MSRSAVYELIGYAGSVLVVVSLMMQSLWRLRVINLVGAAVFATYALLIRSWPVAAVNVVIVGIDVWYIWKMSRQHDYFSVLEVDPDSRYLARFLDFYADDIARFIPGSPLPTQDSNVFFILRDAVPVGLWIAHPIDEHTWSLDVDYVIPRYRDSKAGRFLYGEGSPLPPGIELVVEPSPPVHERYLGAMGFQKAPDGRLRRTVGS